MDAAARQHYEALKQKAPEGFTVAYRPPFFVIGNQNADSVQKWANDTVAWATQRLKAQYFERDPHETIDIWLFRDEPTYRQYAAELFGDTPDTHFGYYNPEHNALVMNIATGGGTLVHEMVHPFMRANFPECPNWFNEGLASLYEACYDRNGRIWGTTNWRLPDLRIAIKEEGVPRFRVMFRNDDDFYGEHSGRNYAQARYLCYYLQEKGLLERFYREFRDNVEDDPGGYETLSTVLGNPDMDAFQKEWEAYVLQLDWP